MAIHPSEREINRFGSARWADAQDLSQAAMFETQGLPFGFYDDQILRFESDAPRTLIGGAGSGKLVGILSYCLCLPCTMSMAVLDPKGELWDISVGTLAAQNIFAYSWDPYQVGEVQHSINPLDHLVQGRPTLFAEIVRLAKALIPLSKSANGKYFELTAQNILIALIFHEVLVFGSIDFPRLHQIINIIESDSEAWFNILESMILTESAFLKSAANTMIRRQADTPKEFGAVMGEIYAYTLWLNDDAIRNSLCGGEASLQEIIDPSLNGGHKVRFHFKVAGDLMEQCAPILRVFFDVILMLKARNRGSEPIVVIVDEAAMLGPFGALKDAFTYGRGSGTITLAVFQDTGQIESNFGREGTITFLGSAAHRQFIGVRDLTTANMVSSMCGYETLEYDDIGRQAEAEHNMRNHINALLDGADPFEAGQHIAHYQSASSRKTKMRRALIDPSEVLNMREDEAISFISGKNIPPIYHNKFPYYERLKVGQFYPNPNHPPIDRIQIGSGWAKKTYSVRRVPVSKNLRAFPQYKNGSMLIISK